MNIETSITVTVRATAQFVTDLPTGPTSRYQHNERVAAWTSVAASAHRRADGTLSDPRCSASGTYLKGDGTPGAAKARMQYGSLSLFPQELADALTAALTEAASRVTVSA